MRGEPFLVHCAKCHHDFAIGFLPMPAADAGRLTKARCPACGSKDVRVGEYPKPTNDGDWRAWLHNGDTGVSSKTIWSVMTGHPVEWYDIPHDPDDFGRCYRLLKIMPSWREQLPKVAAIYPKWKPLIDAWDELTAMYEAELPTGRAPKMYDRMRELIDGAAVVQR